MKIGACPEVDFPKGYITLSPVAAASAAFRLTEQPFHIAAWAWKSSNGCSGKRRYWRSRRAKPSLRCSHSQQLQSYLLHLARSRMWLSLRIAVLGWSDQIYPGHFRGRLRKVRVHCMWVWVSSPQFSDGPLESCFHVRNLWILNQCQVAIFLQSVPTTSSKFFGWCGL